MGGDHGVKKKKKQWLQVLGLVEGVPCTLDLVETFLKVVVGRLDFLYLVLAFTQLQSK